jgi:hypothetical protein
MRSVSYLAFQPAFYRLACLVPIVLSLLTSLLTWPAAAAAPVRLNELSSREDVLRWIDGYRLRPDPGATRTAMRVLSERGALRDAEAAGVYAGFLAGIIGARSDEADGIVEQVLSVLPAEDHWIVVRAIVYSGLPDWKPLLRKFAPRMPSRAVMIEKYLGDKLPPLERVPLETKKPGVWEQLTGYFASDTPKRIEVTYDSSPELLDTLWGLYFATGSYRPVSWIIVMIPWSKDRENVERLTLGSMAKYTLTTNATRNRDLLRMLKRASAHQPKEVIPILHEVIEAAETMETSRIRREALAAIEELKMKGPSSWRQLSLAGKLAEGTVSLGCIAAAASGVGAEVGLPCVIGGALGSAALSAFDPMK